MHPTITALATIGLSLTIAPALAGDGGPDRDWSHKDWSVEQYGGTCFVWTGGDAQGSLTLRIEVGGYNSQATYEPLWFRGHPRPVGDGDIYGVYIDGDPTPYGAEMLAYQGIDNFDWPYFRVDFGPGETPSLIEDLRFGNTLAMQVKRPGQPPRIYDDFSLSGFTATYLKAAEWCKFDPDGLFRS